jgi:hypothetical protein
VLVNKINLSAFFSEELSLKAVPVVARLDRDFARRNHGHGDVAAESTSEYSRS